MRRDAIDHRMKIEKILIDIVRTIVRIILFLHIDPASQLSIY